MKRRAAKVRNGAPNQRAVRIVRILAMRPGNDGRPYAGEHAPRVLLFSER